MNWHIRPWGTALVLALGLVSFSRAQEAAGTTRHFYNKTSFRIPVAIDDRERASLTELRLYVRQMPGGWALTAQGPANQKAFSYQAPSDGEYWFNIATVDQAGKAVPEDPTKHDPALIVVVDTAAPTVEVKPITTATGQTYLQCKMQDAHPNYDSIKIECQSPDGAWKPLEGLANTPGVVQVPNPRMLEGRIKVRAADRAGNVVETEIDLHSPKTAGAPPTVRSMPADALPLEPPVVVKVGGQGPALDPVRPLDAASMAPPPAPTGPAIIIPGVPTTSNKPLPVSTLGSEDASPLPPKPVTEPPASRPTDPLIHTPDLAADGARPDGTKMAIINSNRCRLDFALEPVPGGIAEVEVWATMDNGRNWKPVGTSKDGKSPAVVEFPGEGKYGIAFVVKPINGLVSALPKAGELPDGWLEIDTTLPTADLTAVVPGIGADAGYLMINWIAKDTNFGDAPVTSWYATTPGGPWQVIAERMPAAGTYRWLLPKGITSPVWVRLEARDRAGNVTRCETPQPVSLEGPRARVRVLNIGPARE